METALNQIPQAQPLESQTPAGAPLPQANTSRSWIPWVTSFILSVIFFLIALTLIPVEPWFFWKRVVAAYVLGGEYVMIKDAVMGPDYFDVHIHRARLNKPGWLIVTARDNPIELTYTIFGLSQLLPAGTVQDATIRVPNIEVDLEQEHAQPPLPPGVEITVNILYDTGSGEPNEHMTHANFVKDFSGTIVQDKTFLNLSP